jgi:Helix-turn-helix domain
MREKEKAVEVVEHLTAYQQTMQFEFTAKSTATEVQNRKLAHLLTIRPQSTLDGRAAGIHHMAGRILDLRKRGYRISTSRITAVDADGYTHVGVALYSLERAPEVKQ